MGHADWEQTQVLRGHVGRVLTVSFDRSGQRVGTGSTDQTARIWRSRTGVLDTLLYGHTGYVQDVSFGADGHGHGQRRRDRPYLGR